MISPYVFPGLPHPQAMYMITEERLQNIRSDIELIWNITCRHLKINPELRTIRSRKHNLVFARYIAMYFLSIRSVHGISKTQYYKAIAQYFGKDRTTLIHGINLITDLLALYGDRWKYTPAIKAIAEELSFIWEQQQTFNIPHHDVH